MNITEEPNKTERLDAEGYATTMTQVGFLLGMLADLSVQRAMVTARWADNVGPFLDPTAWLHKHGADNVQDQIAMLERVVPLALLVRKMRAEAIARGVAPSEAHGR
jgi:hypothetical protein